MCFILSYPLLHIPLPGTIPTKIILPYSISPATSIDNSDNIPNQQQHQKPPDVINNMFRFNNFTIEQPFPWANSDPYVYIQQIILRTSVIPWKKNLLLTDAYRGPLHEIFKLLEIVRNHEDNVRLERCININNNLILTYFTFFF